MNKTGKLEFFELNLPIYVFITWLKTVTENLSNIDNFKGALPLFCDPVLFRSLTQQGESNSKGAIKE